MVSELRFLVLRYIDVRIHSSSRAAFNAARCWVQGSEFILVSVMYLSDLWRQASNSRNEADNVRCGVVVAETGNFTLWVAVALIHLRY